MNKFATPCNTGATWSGAPTAASDARIGSGNLYAVRKSATAPKSTSVAKTYVTISVDDEGHIDFESEVEPRYADRMTDVLLLMLLKAREACKQS